MIITINNLPAGLAGGRSTFEPVEFSVDPTGKYAVSELCKNELFVAVNILQRDGDDLLCEYVDSYVYQDGVPMLLKFSLQWDCIPYGFCKLILWAPEARENRGGCFTRTVKRFYFDRELYERRCEEIHGVPSPSQNPHCVGENMVLSEEQ